ncbi:histidine kinase [Sulfuriferula sp. AH1]|uniref:CBS domain-containing protein n=1 Tax=Sulfuriferula sp. AH1 TaxID=1985873 RepID=UPI000B3B2460|nr:CBS domain-containing protein [Sulfuriferula sp. AH1]ARU31810.1 histidine kinase [Sulfuriferula sp. AH1]
MKVRDLMTPNPVQIAPETAVAEIARILIEHHINGVPVADTEGCLLGIVTEGDLVHRAADERLEPRESLWKENFYRSMFRRRTPAEPDKAEGRTAEQVMTRDVLTVAPDSNVIMAARLLADHNIKSLPVIENERLIGIISRFDLIKRLASNADTFNPMSED